MNPAKTSILCAAVAAVFAAPLAAEEAASFDIEEFLVLGSHAVPPIEIERAVYPLLGSGKTIADVEKARDALIAIYRERGFGAVSIDIPEQEVEAGVVRLQVTEGRLDRVRITGARYFANGRIRAAMPSLTQEGPLNLPALQRDLAALNRETADRAITPVLRAGRTPGTVDLELKVEDELPVHGNVEVNDRYTADTTQTRAGASLSYTNLFQKFHSLSLQYQVSPEQPDETRVLAATYVMPLRPGGPSIALYAVDTNSDVATVGTLAVLGAGQIYGARYIAPLPAIEGRYYHSMSLGADYKDFSERIQLTDSSDETPIEYVNWTAQYNGTRRSRHTLSTFDVAVNFGVRGIANEPGPAPIIVGPGGGFYVPGEFGFKRAGAKPNYFYLRAGARHERDFVWGTRLALRLAGQYAPDPLISNEQFSIGGVDTVRGYLESEVLGDYGANGSLEWRTPTLRRAWVAGDFALYGLIFYDAGIVAVQQPLPEQIAEFDLESAGAGIRLSAFGGLEAALDWAYPFQTTNHVVAHDGRIHFSVTYGF